MSGDQTPHSEYADVGKTAITALTPASQGWIFAVVLIVMVLTAKEYFSSVSNDEAVSMLISEMNANYSDHIRDIETNRSEEFRRAQESIKLLADALARDSERAGRVAVETIQSRARATEAEAEADK